MFYVYVLFSKETNRSYVGYTPYLRKRIKKTLFRPSFVNKIKSQLQTCILLYISYKEWGINFRKIFKIRIRSCFYEQAFSEICKETCYSKLFVKCNFRE